MNTFIILFLCLDSRVFGSPRPSVLCKGPIGGSRKRALSHSPLDLGLDIESLTRSSEGSLHLPSVSGSHSSPVPVGCSSGSYGHLSAGMSTLADKLSIAA
jgi:hypothetical protein